MLPEHNITARISSLMVQPSPAILVIHLSMWERSTSTQDFLFCSCFHLLSVGPHGTDQCQNPLTRPCAARDKVSAADVRGNLSNTWRFGEVARVSPDAVTPAQAPKSSPSSAFSRDGCYRAEFPLFFLFCFVFQAAACLSRRCQLELRLQAAASF